MKLLGRWSLASFLKVLIEVPYYGLLLIIPLLCALAVWIALTSGRPGRQLSLTFSVPVRFQLDSASHPFSSTQPAVRAVSIRKAQGELTVDGVPSRGMSLAALGLAIIGLATVLFVLGLLRAVFRTLKDQNPFVRRNSARIRAIGLALILSQLVYAALGGWLTARITRGISVAGVTFEGSPSINAWVLFSGVVLIMLGEVFRLGAEMKGDLETARKIQFDLVPGEVFHKNDVVVNARMRPAKTVGGDLYDVVDLDDQRLAVIVGDVTGKGLPAALLMTSIVGSLRALLAAGLRGSELIAALNRHVCTNTAGGRFVTLFYGELEAGTGNLTYVNAGHNPPFLRRVNGDVDQLPPTAMILGVAADAVVEVGRVRIEPADRLLLFTDGLSEARNTKDEEYGEERVKDSLLRVHELPPPAAMERLVADVQRFCGSAPPHDDMTLMIVERQPA
jgi:hypothetical protein